MSDLRSQLAKHDGCSRWGLEDAAAIKSAAEDSERLEWLIQNGYGIDLPNGRLNLTSGDARAAIDAARKTCTGCPACGGSGLAQSLGRDNDEIIENCPQCNGSGAAS